RAHGQDERAGAMYEQALKVLSEIGEQTGEAIASINLAMVVVRKGQHERAFELLRNSLPFASEASRVFLPTCLVGLAAVAERRGGEVRGGVLFGAAEAVAAQMGPAVHYAARVSYDACLAQLRRPLNASMLDKAWARGKTMTLKRAVSYAAKEAPADAS